MLVLTFGALAGCKDATVGPERLGAIEGLVLDFETDAPIPGASITTSPPTGALVTGEDGRFVLEQIEAGNYTINANHPDYQPNTVTVSVREGRTTQATLFLEEDDEDEDTTQTALAVDVVNWSTYTVNTDTVGADSVFVRVEWRARNAGTADISDYEVYFRIDTNTATFLQEERGDSLQVGQTEVGLFERYTLSEEAQSITVEDVWIAGDD